MQSERDEFKERARLAFENQEMAPPDDSALVQRARQGDLDAFEELVRRHERSIYSLALRITRQEQDAEDLTQQTFISALEHLAAFRGDSSFATWIHRIATHAALKILRKRRGLDTIPLEESNPDDDSFLGIQRPDFIASWNRTPDEMAHLAETRQLIEKALDELDDKHRLVFILRDLEGLNVRDTASLLQISEVNVKVRLLRARLMLRERLTRTFGDPQTAVSPGHHHH